MWARGEWQANFPISVQQLQLHRRWDHVASHLPVFPDYSKTRPAGMVIASGPVQTTQVPAAVVGDIDESIMTEQAKKALKKVEEGIRKEREQWEDTGEEAGDENVDGGVAQSGIGRVYAISDQASRLAGGCC